MAHQPLDFLLGLSQPTFGFAADIRQADQFTVTINDTTRVTIHGAFTAAPNSSSIYNSAYASPQAGTITSYEVETLSGPGGTAIGRTVVTGNFPTLDFLFNEIVYPANAVVTASPWQPIIPTTPPPLIFANANQFEFLNTDNTRTVVFGSGFTYANGIAVGGQASSIGLFNNAGNIQLGGGLFTSNALYGGQPFYVSPDLIYDALFATNIQDAFFTALFAGATSVTRTGTNDFAGDPFEKYFAIQNLVGDDGDNTLTGSLGDDFLNGGFGADTMSGGAGNDTYYVDNPGDAVVEVVGNPFTGGLDYVIVFGTSYNMATQAQGAEKATLSSGGGFALTGNTLANTLEGNESANVITGGLGKDTMRGGAGHDVFDFNAINEIGKTAATRDVILDFKHKTDDIDLKTIDAKTGGGNQAFTFIGTEAFHHVKGELHYSQKGGHTIVEGDTNGDGKADFQIDLAGKIALTKIDFIL
jgi:hypothetical protein